MRKSANISCGQQTIITDNEATIISHMKCHIYFKHLQPLSKATYIEGTHFTLFHAFK